jgi:hypothetical protein
MENLIDGPLPPGDRGRHTHPIETDAQKRQIGAEIRRNSSRCLMALLRDMAGDLSAA